MANVHDARSAISEAESFLDSVEDSLNAIAKICRDYADEEDVEALQQSLEEISNEADEALRNLL